MNVVFDLGKVLIDWDPRHLFRPMFEDPDKMEWFLENVCHNEWNLEQDRGRSFADGVIEAKTRHPNYVTEIEAYHLRWNEMVPGAIAGSVDILETLHKKGTPLYAITNWNGDTFRQTKLRFPFLNLFRDIVVSGDEGLIKPDAAIYQKLLTRNKLKAETCVFIDDSLKNVKGAEAVSMKAIHFTGPDALRAALKSMEVL